MARLLKSKGLKVLLTKKEYGGLVVERRPGDNFDEAMELLKFPSGLELSVSWKVRYCPETGERVPSWETPNSKNSRVRFWGLVSSQNKLGSYVGVSCSENGKNYHIGVMNSGNSPAREAIAELLLK